MNHTIEWIKGPLGHAATLGRSRVTIGKVRLGSGKLAWRVCLNGCFSNLPNFGVANTLPEAKAMAETAMVQQPTV